jgi:hypothetical protein
VVIPRAVMIRLVTKVVEDRPGDAAGGVAER